MSQETSAFSLSRKVSKNSLGRVQHVDRKRPRQPIKSLISGSPPKLSSKDVEIARLEQEFFEYDAKKPKKSKGPPIPASFSCPDSDDEVFVAPKCTLSEEIARLVQSYDTRNNEATLNISEQLSIIERNLGHKLEGASRIKAKKLLLQNVQHRQQEQQPKGCLSSNEVSDNNHVLVVQTDHSTSSEHPKSIERDESMDGSKSRKDDRDNNIQESNDPNCSNIELEQDSCKPFLVDLADNREERNALRATEHVQRGRGFLASARLIPSERPSETVEIKSKVPLVKLMKHHHLDGTNVAISSPTAVIAGKRTSKARKTLKESEPKKRKSINQKQRTGCKLCKDCPCTKIPSRSEESHQGTDLSLARSMAAQERSLIRLMQISQKEADFHSARADRYRRDLEKLRKQMWKQRGGSLQATAKPRTCFLPDIIELDERLNTRILPLPASAGEISRAQKAIFDTSPVRQQPTLTQLFANETKPNSIRISLGIDQQDDFLANDSTLSDDHAAPEISQRPIPEDSLGPLDNRYDDISVESGFLLPVITAPHNRLHGNSPHGQGIRSVWASFETSVFTSDWDHLFVDAVESNTEGLEELIKILESHSVPCFCNEPSSDVVDWTVMSPGGREIAAAVIEEWERDTHKRTLLAQTQPNWRENVRFALLQRNGSAIRQAREHVLHEKARMNDLRERFLLRMTSLEYNLDLFDHVLKCALERAGKSNGTPSSASRNRRETMDTIVPSALLSEPFDTTPS